MPQAPFALDPADQCRVQRVRVQILADGSVYEGYVHLLGSAARVHELLNDPKPFLNVTDVTIHDRNNASTAHVAYCALNKGSITHVLLLAGDSDQRGREEPTPAPSRKRPTGPQASMALGPKTAPPQPPLPHQGAPMIPPAGPKTLPGPAPAPIASRSPNEPPTQPFHKEGRAADDEVSDLILDDDHNDDIDPDDLERDLGALITGQPKG